jgi:hypothetical protein
MTLELRKPTSRSIILVHYKTPSRYNATRTLLKPILAYQHNTTQQIQRAENSVKEM